MEDGPVATLGTPGPPGRIKVLRLDHTGQPAAWLTWQQAAVLYSLGKVAWTAGEQTLRLHGGTNRASGCQSVIEIHSIVATRGRVRREARRRKVPPLSNRALFLRDGIHPTAEAQPLIVDNVWPALVPLLGASG